MIQPEIVKLESKILVGIKKSMSLTENSTGELWRSFMPARKAIEHIVSDDLYSVQFYPADYFQTFNPAKTFEKFAGREVKEIGNFPSGMESVILPGGLYAVFHYKGPANDPAIFQYIYSQWLPQSAYRLDDRPHFEVLGANYKNADPGSEEDIYIPVQPK